MQRDCDRSPSAVVCASCEEALYLGAPPRQLRELATLLHWRYARGVWACPGCRIERLEAAVAELRDRLRLEEATV